LYRAKLFLTLLLLGLVSYAQEYSYVFTDGWQAEKVFQSDGKVFCLGIGRNELGHQLLVGNVNHNYEPVLKYQNERLHTSLSSSDNLHQLDDSTVIITGVQVKGQWETDALIAFLNTNTGLIESTESFNVKNRTFGLQSFGDISHLSSFGVYLTDTTESNGRVNTFLRTKNGDNVSFSLFGCSGFNNYGGCQLTFRNALETNNNGYLFSSYAGARYEPNFRTGVIIKTDSLGNEEWRIGVGNDSTSCHNLLVAPLANGNYLAVWQDFYYKPNKSPNNNKYPTINKNVTGWFKEFDVDGKDIREWRFRDIVGDKVTSPDFLFYNHTVLGKDSCIYLTGNTRDSGQLGFLLKLNKFGEYQWYRQYEVSVNKPHTNGVEKLYINGVTELKSGSIALAGEYRSDPSDSFPQGAQKGVVLFVDEHGCFKPNCHLTDNVEELKAKRSVFTVYPNPNNGEFTVSNEQGNKLNKVEVLDMNGRVVFLEKIEREGNRFKFNLPVLSSQVYFLKLFRDDGFFEVHKVVVW
jgi:hypothetical protein